MQSRLLTSVAFIFGLGVVGCDDPEVQSKVEDLLLHGGVEAYAHCYTASNKSLCDSSYNQQFAFKVYRFQDGSSYLSFRRSQNNLTVQQFNHRGLDIKAEELTVNGSSGYFAEIDEGDLITRAHCPTLGIDYTDTVDINSNMTCSGFNTEVFGIDP